MSKVSARAWKRLKLLITLTVAAAFLLLMPSRFTAPARILFNEAAGPVQTAVFQGSGEMLAASGTLTEMFTKEDRERALAREVIRLRNANVALADQVRRQHQRLLSTAMLRVKEFPFRAVRAPVSSYDSSATSRSITVRAGSSDDVAPGMAVAADGALVGILVEVGRWQSRVRLITDPRSAVPCRVGATHALCILQGTGGDNCILDWVDRDGFVEPGDAPVTASMDVDPESRLTIPDGLPAATVSKVERDEMRPLFLSVEARPRVNLDRLEGVEILIPQQ